MVFINKSLLYFPTTTILTERDHRVTGRDRQQSQTMKIVGSKAFYLKTFTIKSRAKTEPRDRYSSPQAHLTDIARIRKLTRHSHIDDYLPLPIPVSHPHSRTTKLQTIQQKEQDLLERICRSKVAQSGRRRMRYESVTVQRHPIASVDTLELAVMKPTDRYFQQVQNIRLAERLLLAKPSRQVTRDSQHKFYQQQEAYRLNISKISSQNHHQRSLHRRKWVD